MNLITDRKQANVNRLAELSRKRWDSMTSSEKAEWSGNPFTAGDFDYSDAVNLIPTTGTGVIVRDGSIIATESGVIPIGDASYFAGNAVTLSAEYVSPGGELSLVWSDGVSADCVLSTAGTVTETLNESTGAILQLVASPGYYGKVMLELGRVRHEYVPYTEVLPTETTLGAYNYSDLNRVERAVKEIAEILGVTVETKTNWTGWDIPENSEMVRYLGNIRRIQEICGETTRIPETMEDLTYSTANRIEEVLLRCRTIAEATLRCGELICGEVL